MAQNRTARLRLLTARLVTYARMAVVAAGAVTASFIAAIVSLQLGFWLATQRWSPLPVSRIFELAEVDTATTYALASESSRPRTQGLTEWLLDLPAIVVLFVALALFAVLYAWLASVEKGLGTAPAPPEKG
jgi:hypothetical protein